MNWQNVLYMTVFINNYHDIKPVVFIICVFSMKIIDNKLWSNNHFIIVSYQF